MRHRTVTALLAAISILAGPVVGPASAAGTSQVGLHCADPNGDADFASADPAAAHVDPAALAKLLDWATTRNSTSVRVYRHGCLIGTSRLDPLTEDQPWSWNSGTKSVVALTVGRAVELGKLSLDDPVGKYFPEADATHRQILLRHLITQSGGLRGSLTGDTWNASGTDGVRLALHQQAVHPPGTWFEYQQHGLTLLLACVQRAVGEDVQKFVQRELFGKLGISRDDWFWVRDRAGWSEGWYGLFLSPRLMPRLAQLMLNDGIWAGTRLLPSTFVHDAQSSNPVSGGYGYLMWTNHGGDYWTSTLPSRYQVNRPLVPSAPRDLYMFAGLGGQYLYIIPSLDVVIERSGGYPSYGIEPGLSEGSRADGEFNWELFRRLGHVVTDVHWSDPGPYQPINPGAPQPAAVVEPEGTLAGLGVGPRAGGCNLAGCDGRVDLTGYRLMQEEAANYFGQGVNGATDSRVAGLPAGQTRATRALHRSSAGHS